MKLKGIKADGYRIDKKGKLIRVEKRVSVSERIRQRSSKRIKVAR